MPEESPLRPRSGLTVRRLGEELVVLDRSGGRVHQLNPTASFIYESFDGQRSIAEVVARVVEHFEVEPEAAANDVSELVARLAAEGILVESGPKGVS